MAIWRSSTINTCSPTGASGWNDGQMWELVHEIPDAGAVGDAPQAQAPPGGFRARARSTPRRHGAKPRRRNCGVCSEVLDPDAFTIGFARRFATYKRATLLFRDVERLKRIL